MRIELIKDQKTKIISTKDELKEILPEMPIRLVDFLKVIPLETKSSSSIQMTVGSEETIVTIETSFKSNIYIRYFRPVFIELEIPKEYKTKNKQEAVKKFRDIVKGFETLYDAGII